MMLIILNLAHIEALNGQDAAGHIYIWLSLLFAFALFLAALWNFIPLVVLVAPISYSHPEPPSDLLFGIRDLI